MELSQKNFAYLTCEKTAVRLLVCSGALLWLLLPLGLWKLPSPVFIFLWVAHLLVQTAATGWAIRLLLLFGRTLEKRVRIVLAAVLAAMVAVVLSQAFLPVVSRDALIYHLAVPKIWLAAGQIREIPWHEWSHFPLLLSLSYSGFVHFGLEQLASLYHASYLIIAAAAAAAFVYYKYQDEELAIFSALLAATMPVCMKLAAEPMSDLALACFFGVGYALFIFWVEQKGTFRQLAVISVLFGLGLCCKYNSLLALGIFSLCMLSFLQRWSRSLPQAAGAIGALLVIAFAVYSPWPMKNYLATGNPVYPFAGSVFGVSDELPFMGSVKPLQYRLGAYDESWTDIFLIPLRMMFTGVDDNPRQFDGLLSPLLLLGVVPLLSLRKTEQRTPWVENTWMYVAGYFLLSLTSFYALLRYQLPLLIPMSVLSAAGLRALSEWRPGGHREAIVRGALALQVLWSGIYLGRTAVASGAMHHWMSGESREDFLNRRVGEFELAEEVNRKLPKDAVVYLLFTGHRYFYYDRDVRGSYFSQAPVVAWLKAEASGPALARKFREAGYTHLAVHNKRAWDTLNRSLEPNEKAAWTAFVRDSLTLVYQNESMSLWELRSGE